MTVKMLEEKLEVKEADNLRFQREVQELERKLKSLHDEPEDSKVLENEKRISKN